MADLENVLVVELAGAKHAVVYPPILQFALARELAYGVANPLSVRGWSAIVGLCVPSVPLKLPPPPPATQLYDFGGKAWEGLVDLGCGDSEIRKAGELIYPRVLELGRWAASVSKEDAKAARNFSPAPGGTSGSP